MQSAKVCVVLSVVALAMFGPLSAVAKPGYAAAYDSESYYVRVFVVVEYILLIRCACQHALSVC